MIGANLVEIFSSVQGEGTHVGETTLFFRFGECDLRCRWCDSPQTWKPSARCRIETQRGRGAFRVVANPVTITDAVKAAEALDLGAHRFASLTGGEPLLQPEAAGALARALKPMGARIYLETHGLHTEALESLVDTIDLVSMDWKLASDVKRASDRRGETAADFHEAHERFLRVARRASEVLVKVVVTPETRDLEIDELCARVAATDAKTSIVVQPVTPFGAVSKTPDAERLLALVTRIGRVLPNVRLIPQTHRIYDAP